jgi:hypothetical protein
MPSANEAALAELLREVGLPTNNEEAVAQYLAQRGVLVPAALSDDDARYVGNAYMRVPDFAWEEGEVVRSALERLARGEAAA